MLCWSLLAMASSDRRNWYNLRTENEKITGREEINEERENTRMHVSWLMGALQGIVVAHSIAAIVENLVGKEIERVDLSLFSVSRVLHTTCISYI